jgi:hypothetical protein
MSVGRTGKNAYVPESLLPDAQLLVQDARTRVIVIRRMTALVALLTATAMTACGLRCTNPSTETLTIYQDAPTMNPLDHGPPGNSPGDVYHFFAPLHSSPGGPVTGEVFGTKTLVKLATDTNPNLERRATLLFFTFSDRSGSNYRFWGCRLFAEPLLSLRRAGLSCARS